MPPTGAHRCVELNSYFLSDIVFNIHMLPPCHLISQVWRTWISATILYKLMLLFFKCWALSSQNGHDSRSGFYYQCNLRVSLLLPSLNLTFLICKTRWLFPAPLPVWSQDTRREGTWRHFITAKHSIVGELLNDLLWVNTTSRQSSGILTPKEHSGHEKTIFVSLSLFVQLLLSVLTELVPTVMVNLKCHLTGSSNGSG